MNWLRYRAVQHRFFCYWRKRYSSRALLAETATDMVCDNLAFTWNVKHLRLTLNLFYRCHIALYTPMSVQGITEKKGAVVFLLLLYFVHAFCQHTDHKVRLHALRETVTDHGVGSYPRQLVSSIWVDIPGFPIIVPIGFMYAL